jgi:hypothetical protein
VEAPTVTRSSQARAL